MTWTDPTTQSTGNLITAATWNAEVADNLTHLHDRFVESVFPFHQYESIVGNYAGSNLGVTRYTSFMLPPDMDTLMGVDVIAITNSGGSISCNIDSHYAFPGEAYSTNSESISGLSMSALGNAIAEIDVSGVFSGVQAGHMCGLRYQSTSGVSLLLGLRLRYMLV